MKINSGNSAFEQSEPISDAATSGINRAANGQFSSGGHKPDPTDPDQKHAQAHADFKNQESQKPGGYREYKSQE
jgi:hypothetical protein